MSEFQYYEFLAIDRPLSAEEMAELRELSTRASITPVSFTNEYHWGNFRGNTDQLMERYFDAHVYVANWMTAIFMLRLPADCLDEKMLFAAEVPDILHCDAVKDHWIITWMLESSEDYDRFAEEDGRGWMASLAPVRDELLRGDLRGLYIGWLAAVSRKRIDNEEEEPFSVSGLANLTSAQLALAKFLEVDPDFLAGAGMGNPAARDMDVSSQEMDNWLEALPREEVQSILKQLLEGKGQQAERALRNRFASWQRSLQPDETDVTLRTVGELRQNAMKARQIRLKKQKQERLQRELKKRREREAYLKVLSEDFPGAWAAVRTSIQRGTGSGYDIACSALADLSEAYALYVSREQFEEHLKNCLADYMRRTTLIQRLVKAGLWKGRSHEQT